MNSMRFYHIKIIFHKGTQEINIQYITCKTGYHIVQSHHVSIFIITHTTHLISKQTCTTVAVGSHLETWPVLLCLRQSHVWILISCRFHSVYLEWYPWIQLYTLGNFTTPWVTDENTHSPVHMDSYSVNYGRFSLLLMNTIVYTIRSLGFFVSKSKPALLFLDFFTIRSR